MRILLIRLREIGDVVLLPRGDSRIAWALSQAHLSYIVEPLAAPIVAQNPHLDDVIVAPRRGGFRGLLHDVAFGRRLRAARYDLVVDFHSGPRSSLMAWLSGAPTRVGYDVPGRGWMYTTRVTRPREIRARHAVENQFDLLNAIGIPTPDPTYSPTEMTVDGVAAVAVDERLASLGVRDDDELIVIHVSAGNPFRRCAAGCVRVAHRHAAAPGRPKRRVMVVAGPWIKRCRRSRDGRPIDRSSRDGRSNRLLGRLHALTSCVP
jgi:ADP-heptose:LPS heptosyltransferase